MSAPKTERRIRRANPQERRKKSYRRGPKVKLKKEKKKVSEFAVEERKHCELCIDQKKRGGGGGEEGKKVNSRRGNGGKQGERRAISW